MYYLMTASAGIEVGSFNLAYLCELSANEDIVVGLSSSFTRADCMWKYYNQSIYADINAANGYALIKMADFHFDKSTRHDLDESIKLYTLAYRRGEAQASDLKQLLFLCNVTY